MEAAPEMGTTKHLAHYQKRSGWKEKTTKMEKASPQVKDP